MLNRRRALYFVPFLFLFLACSSSAQAPKDAESLRKEIDALKAQQAEMQKSLEEIREFLRAATGGRFGAPSLVGTTFDIAGTPVNGRADAPITIVEISDYHCPFCRRHVQQTQPRIYDTYVQAGKVRHAFVHYPIAQLHPDAHRSHEAAMCAADQGKFWELHAKLFEKPARTVDELTAVAQIVAGVDATALRGCLESGKYTKAVQESVARVAKLNISGTPMFLVGRTAPDGKITIAKIIEGAQPFEAFKMAVDETLAAK